jgi:hypothetical protein
MAPPSAENRSYRPRSLPKDIGNPRLKRLRDPMPKRFRGQFERPHAEAFGGDMRDPTPKRFRGHFARPHAEAF